MPSLSATLEEALLGAWTVATTLSKPHREKPSSRHAAAASVA